MKTTIPTQKLKDINVFVVLKRHMSIQISIVTRDNTADALDFYVENARSITHHIAKIDPNPSPNPKNHPQFLTRLQI